MSETAAGIEHREGHARVRACFECGAHAARRKVGDGRGEVRDETGDMMQPRLVRGETVAQCRGRIIVLRDQLDHHLAGLTVGGGMVEPTGRTAVTDLLQRDVFHEIERTPAVFVRETHRGLRRVGHMVGDLHRAKPEDAGMRPVGHGALGRFSQDAATAARRPSRLRLCVRS